MTDKGTYYITTPIYYPSSNLHVGHTYCTVMADAMARFKRLVGFDVMFLTGTDEHGQKIQRIAEEAGISPQEHVDGIVAGIKDLWATMEISYDDFIRTTEDRHKRRVQEIFKKIYEAGDIYRGEYEGWYCTPCESYWTDVQLVDGKCPDCGRLVEKAKETAYFFKMSKYADRLLELLESEPYFLEPETRRNEMIQFVKQGLEDLCISRGSFDWGIPVPIEDGQVIYVWLDALSNYITALGWPAVDGTPGEDDKCRKYWPADVHLVGKEIVRFHTLIWPAMLMSMNVPLPKKVLGHGWLLLSGGKMSKSKGNVVDPVTLIERYGVDALKYFLLREYTFGQDGLFTNEALLGRINGDLANDLGNLLSRWAGMAEKFVCGHVRRQGRDADQSVCAAATSPDNELKELAVSVAGKVEAHMDGFAFNHALEEIWTLIRRSNKYIDETMPWALAKDEAQAARLEEVLYNLGETLRIVSILIQPFMHYSSAEIRKQLGITDVTLKWEDASVFGLEAEYHATKGVNLFPRLDIDAELEALNALVPGGTDEESDGTEIVPDLGKVCAEEEVAEAAAKKGEAEYKPEIEYDDFDKLDLRVGEVVECMRHPNADKLLVFQIRMGNETRQIVSGVAGSYAPGDCVGRKVIVVANLKPRMLRGEESKGMLLFADNGDRYEFVTTEAPHGEKVT
ncbi:MAG: methionine--tRNA ligase [Clostridiales Family XIII bacterium]|jgi:methionyl-tRNA synthetase|nr:methionine--tRNA ligase [Clostridiales Family XIII bacterium]